jgi:uncharacterized protein YgbK (DUF1537 family)
VPGPTVFDGLTDRDCALVAGAIWRAAEAGPTVVLSAQGFAYGFGRFRRKRPAEGPQVEPLSRVGALLVVSGSAAPLTARQIGAFAEAGAATLRFQASRSLDAASADVTLESAVGAASRELSRGRSVCLYTALGPEDEDTPALREVAARLRLDHAEVARRIGEALGAAVLQLVERHSLARVAVAGGDTASYALRRMKPQGLAVASGDYATSAHVFRLSGASPVEGLEVTMKGGQVGDEGFFLTLRDGRAGSPS